MPRAKGGPIPQPKINIHPGHGGSISVLNDNDVISGRGRANNLPGNIAYRKLVKSYKHAYLDPRTRKLAKVHIAARLVAQVRSLGGRFLTDDTINPGYYVEIGDEKAWKKAGQALREDAPDVRSRLLGAVSPDIDITKNRVTSPMISMENKETTNQQSSSTRLPPIKKRKYQECTNDARSREGVCINGKKKGHSMEKVVSTSKAASRRNIIDLSIDDDNDLYNLSSNPSKEITMGGKLQQITPQHIRYQKHEIATLKNEITSRDEEIAQLKQTLGGIVARDVQILERDKKIVTNIRELELKDTRMKKKMRLYKAKKNNEIATLKDQVALKENDIIRLKAELKAKDENEKKLVQVKQEEREEAWITLEDVREDLEIANETVTQQAVFTDGWQSKFDQLAAIAQAAGVDALTILGIRDQSIA